MHPRSADEELDGPIELFSQAEHSAKLPLDLEEEEEPVDIKDVSSHLLALFHISI